MFTQENGQNHDVLAQEPDDTRRNNETPITAGLFVDDGSLHTAADSPTTNAKRLFLFHHPDTFLNFRQ